MKAREFRALKLALVVATTTTTLCALNALLNNIKIVTAQNTTLQQIVTNNYSSNSSSNKLTQCTSQELTTNKLLSKHKKLIFCYYDIQDDFRPQDANGCICTHVVYSFVAVRRNLSFIAGRKGDLRSLAALKQQNANVKLLVSIRPDDFFSFNNSNSNSIVTTTNNNNTLLQPSNETHVKLARRIKDFLTRHSLDGVSLDWPYFLQALNSHAAAKAHLTLALTALNEQLRPASTQAASYNNNRLRATFKDVDDERSKSSNSMLIALTLAKDFHSLISAFDFKPLARLVDYFTLPAFDFDLSVDQYSIGHPARLHGLSDTENLDTLVDLLLSSGVASEQLVAGIPTHGVQITSRATQAQQILNSNASLDAQIEAAANISIVPHSTVCKVRALAAANATLNCTLLHSMQRTNATQQQQQQQLLNLEPLPSCWTLSRARDLTAPFAFDAEHWLGFDDSISVKLKAKYALLRHLAGVAIFTLNNDDPRADCSNGKTPFPLTNAAYNVFARAVTSSSSSSSASLMPIIASSLVNQAISNNNDINYHKQHSSSHASSVLMHDLQAAASEQQASIDNTQNRQQQLTSFADIIEKYSSSLQGEQFDDSLPCFKVGYQRHPRDCSRFYRCVQTPPQPSNVVNSSSSSASTSASAAQLLQSPQQQQASSSLSLQYECPSGLVFDEHYQICNWPSWSNECAGSGEVNAIQATKFACSSYGYFQSNDNCEYFYYCSNYNNSTLTLNDNITTSKTHPSLQSKQQQQHAYQFRCPFKLGFDEEKLVCNHKSMVRGCAEYRQANKTLVALQTTSDARLMTDKSTQVDKLLQSSDSIAQHVDIQRLVKRSAPPVNNNNKDNDDSDEDLLANSRNFHSTLASNKRRASLISIPSWTSHVTSLLESVSAIVSHIAKKNAEFSDTKNSNKRPQLAASSSSVNQANNVQTNFKSPAQFLRRRNTATATATTTTADGQRSTQTSTVQASNTVNNALPYKQRPAPPSIFPFLPSSAVYMLTDSLRSYGEAMSAEVNRLIRNAGDAVRAVLGTRPASGVGTNRADFLESTLTGVTHRSKRAKRSLLQTTSSDDLQAVESELQAAYLPHLLPARQHSSYPAPRPLVAANYAPVQPPRPAHVPAAHQQHIYKHADPLGRPPGYPLNPLDNAARAAVLGPEPSLYTQPSALYSKQMSAVSQEELAKLFPMPQATSYNAMQQQQYLQHQQQQQHKPAMIYNQAVQPQQQQQQQAYNDFAMAASDTSEVSISPTQILANEVPFGMPSIQNAAVSIAPSASATLTSIQVAQQQADSNAKQTKRIAIGKKLTAFTLPHFAASSTTAQANQQKQQLSNTQTASSAKQSQQQQQQQTSTTSSYKSFFPTLGSVVTAPARTLFNKALDINKAMYDLMISTLSPSSSSLSKKQKGGGGGEKATTPLPRLPVIMQHAQQHVQQFHLPQQQADFLQQLQQQYHNQGQQQQQQQQHSLSMAGSIAQPQYLQAQYLQPSHLHLQAQQQPQIQMQAPRLKQQQQQQHKLATAQQQALSSHYMQQQQQQQRNTSSQHKTQYQLFSLPQLSTDYATQLFKSLKDQSSNPEDVKLLEQLINSKELVSDSNDPSAISSDKALLEALGMLGQQQQQQQGELDDNLLMQQFMNNQDHKLSSAVQGSNEAIKNSSPQLSLQLPLATTLPPVPSTTSATTTTLSPETIGAHQHSTQVPLTAAMSEQMFHHSTLPTITDLTHAATVITDLQREPQSEATTIARLPILETSLSSQTTTTQTPTTTTTTTSTTTTTTTTTTAVPLISRKQKQPRKSRSQKKQKQNFDKTNTNNDNANNNNNDNDEQQHSNVHHSTRHSSSGEHKKEIIAVYGTKSGFMPIITVDNPSYALSSSSSSSNNQYLLDDDATPEVAAVAGSRINNFAGSVKSPIKIVGSSTQLTMRPLNTDPLLSSASIAQVNVSQQALTQNQLLTNTHSQRQTSVNNNYDSISASDNKQQQQQQQQQQMQLASWRKFSPKPDDQINVVDLGEFIDAQSSQTMLSRLIILLGTPDAMLADTKNWLHLSTMYPSLFPASVNLKQQLKLILLGATNIMLNEHVNLTQSDIRFDEFENQFKPMSSLFDKLTFMALDEIVQRSSGAMYSFDWPTSNSRTIIAVIPETKKPFIATRNSSFQSTNEALQVSNSRTTAKQTTASSSLSIPTTTTPPTTTTTTTTTPSTTTTIANSNALPMISTSNTNEQPQTFNNNNQQQQQQQSKMQTVLLDDEQLVDYVPSPTIVSTSAGSSARQRTQQQQQQQQHLSGKKQLRKAATFSRALTESIQDAIRQHNDAIKSKLMLETQKLTTKTTPTTTTTSSDVSQQTATTTVDTLASVASSHELAFGTRTDFAGTTASNLQKHASRLKASHQAPLITTTPTLNTLPPTTTTTTTTTLQPPTPTTLDGRPQWIEVNGAEPSSLYGIEISPQTSTPRPETPTTRFKENTSTRNTSQQLKEKQQQSRFVSIGEHLIETGKPRHKLRVVDQAYVNHFYDHISGSQLAKLSTLNAELDVNVNNDTNFDINTNSTNATTTTTTSTSQTSASLEVGDDLRVPESACTRQGLFQHPFACNKFYECFWDSQLERYTLHMFDCPIKLAFDDRVVGCASAIESSLCVNY